MLACHTLVLLLFKRVISCDAYLCAVATSRMYDAMRWTKLVCKCEKQTNRLAKIEYNGAKIAFIKKKPTTKKNKNRSLLMKRQSGAIECRWYSAVCLCIVYAVYVCAPNLCKTIGTCWNLQVCSHCACIPMHRYRIHRSFDLNFPQKFWFFSRRKYLNPVRFSSVQCNLTQRFFVAV